MSKLIGTNPNQVPSNADLGTAAFMDKKDFLLSKGSSLSAIDKVLPESGVGFIYDTTLDSDGGAWRYRTKQTSWYKEPLNTATRGSRREFPQVALIMREGSGTSGKIVIYDADDPNLPMWMVFDAVQSSMWYNTSPLTYQNSSAIITSIVAKNGHLAASTTPFGYGSVNFITDDGEFRENGYFRRNQDPISLRNSTTTTQPFPELGSQFHIENTDTINAMAITVLPDARISEQTGLPIPTIACATNVGVTVISDKTSGLTFASGSTLAMQGICFDEDYNLWYSRNTSNEYILFSPYGEYTSGDGFGGTVASSDTTARHFPLLTRARQITSLENGEIAVRGSSSGSFNHPGISKYYTQYPKVDNTRSTLGCAINKEFNTGWLPNYCMLALSDSIENDIGRMDGTNLITNGTFTGGSSTGWTAGGNTTLSVVNDKLRVTNISSGASTARQTVTLVAGKTYVLGAELDFGNHFSGNVYIISPSGVRAGLITRTRESSPSDGYYYGHYTAEETGLHTVELYGSTSAGGYYVDFDDIQLSEGVPSRSVENVRRTGDTGYTGGMRVSGVVNREPVASNSDLVGYTGFSSNNKLFAYGNETNQFNDIGTGDFSVVCWAKRNGDGLQVIFEFGEQGDSAGVNSYAAAFAVNGTPYWQTHTSSTDFLRTSNSGLPVPDGKWVHLAMTRDASGIKMYVNGDFWSQANGLPKNVTNTAAGVLWVGLEMNSLYPLLGSIALFRISKITLSPEQISKMYHDEKGLFTDNSKCLLKGSNAVVDIDYDDSTKLLHAVSNAGRSSFDGLIRVEETDDEITNYVMSVNGLIIED